MELLKRVLSAQWHVWVLVALVLVGALLRSVRYWEFPVVGETQDEVAWTMLGASLVQNGRPTSWSYFSGYTEVEQVRNERGEFRLVTPALDHPPLFSLAPGIMTTLTGHAWDVIPSMKIIRLPMVLLGILNVALFAWLMDRATSSRVWKIVSVFVFATVPTVVFLSRLVVSEQLLITIMLGIMLITTYASFTWKKLVIVLLHALLPLTKVAGLAIAAGSIAAYWGRKRNEEAGLAFLGTVIGVALWCLYAAAFDWDLFLAIQTQQAQRDVGLITLFQSQVWTPSLVLHHFADAWPTLGLAALALSIAGMTKKGKVNELDAFVRWTGLAYIAFMLFSVGENTIHGWYRLPLWPLMAYALGSIALEIWRTRSWISLSLATLLLAPTPRLAIIASLGTEFQFAWRATLSKLWLVMAGGFTMPHFLELPKQVKDKIWYSFCAVVLGLILISHVITALTLRPETYWKDAAYLETGLKL